ncbi:MAG TPA: AtzE family amidohydrolase [Solirubrobacteraceae bacterium]
MTIDGRGAAEIVAAVRERRVTAEKVVEATLATIAERDPALNCFTAVTAERAHAEARRVDASIAAGDDPGPLAGVPFAVKNLFDVAGLTTLAGSRINRERPPASRDAAAVRALGRAGAVLVGALNMDEYAFGFTTENSHHGSTRNPRDRERMAGGSSGGSAAAVAAGLVPIALGTDTNGSIRVPASFCGVFALKPTYGRVSRAGVALFAASFDHVGPFARSTHDLALAFDTLQGHDADDPVSSTEPPAACLPHLDAGIDGLRLAIAAGDFRESGEPEVFAAVDRVAAALGVDRRVVLPETPRARAAAMLITSSEGANLHLDDLRTRAAEFDPMTRDMFLAGAFVPAAAYVQAQRFRAWYRDRLREIFREVDVLITPTTPCAAPLIGEARRDLGGGEMWLRPHLGVYTRPFSFVGLPALTVPVHRPGALPLGVQLVAAPFVEATLFRVARRLEADGLAFAPVA